MDSRLNELADRCERAAGPDRDLDVAVAFAIGRVRERDGNYLYATGNDSDMVVEPNTYDDHIVAQPLSYYTSSIDAAMTLVPESPHVDDRHWQVNTLRGTMMPDGGFHAAVYVSGSWIHARGATPANALSAAALRARAARGEA